MKREVVFADMYLSRGRARGLQGMNCLGVPVNSAGGGCAKYRIHLGTSGDMVIHEVTTASADQRNKTISTVRYEHSCILLHLVVCGMFYFDLSSCIEHLSGPLSKLVIYLFLVATRTQGHL
jgi:hypothetical protein